MWPGEGSSQHRPQLCKQLTVLQRVISILSLSFSLKKRLFSEGHGPKMLLRTSHVLSHDEPMSWQGTDGKNDRGEVTCASQMASKSDLNLVFQSLQNSKNAKDESPRGLAPS